MDKNINITLKVWRQKGPKEKGAFETYQLKDISQGSSFLEMLDVLNEQLVNEGREPVFFDHDCREGICGMCSLYINGHPHGPDSAITTCQLHMRKFHEGETITIEPWRSAGFPIIRDLTVDRQAYDKIMQASSRSTPAASPTPTPFQSRRRTPTSPWTLLPALVAAPAPQLAKTARLCSSFRPKSASWRSSRKDASRQHAAPKRWWPRWTN